MNVLVNGDRRDLPSGCTIAELLRQMGLSSERVAVELNLDVLDRSALSSVALKEGDKVEVVGFVGGGAGPSELRPSRLGTAQSDADPSVSDNDAWVLGGIKLRSRLIVGTGKFKDFADTRRVVEASGADMVTVAVRRVNIIDRNSENLLDYLDPKTFKILPNTAGCYTAEEAVRTARLARSAGISDLVKLEVIGDPKTLFPDTAGLIEAARLLVKEGFIVLPYTNDDPVVAKRLEDAGCAAVMPLAAPIGSGLGIRNPYNLRIIMEQVRIPVIVDAGVGTASDAAIAMELGCDGVLMNTGIAGAKNPLAMAHAMKYAVRAGRLAYQAGRIPKKLYATASSPTEGMIESSSGI
jgi:thiazole synthase